MRWTWKLTLSTSPFNYVRASAEIESADSSRRVDLVDCCRLDRPSSFSPQHHQHSVRTQLKLARNLINLRKVFLHGRSELVSFSLSSLTSSIGELRIRSSSAEPYHLHVIEPFLSKTSSASAVWHVFADSDHRTPGHQPEPKIDFHFSFQHESSANKQMAGIRWLIFQFVCGLMLSATVVCRMPMEQTCLFFCVAA